MTQIDYKRLKKTVTEEHNKNGASLTYVHSKEPVPVDVEIAVDMLPGLVIGEVDGTKVTPKQIGRVLFKVKDTEAFNKPNAAVFSTYDPDENLSMVGVALISTTGHSAPAEEVALAS